MSLTQSNMLPLGTIAPDFTLPDTVSGKVLSLSALQSPRATVVMFLCNHCPYVVHIQSQLVKVVREYQAKGVSFIGISSNDVTTHPDDAPDKMQIMAQKAGFSFPYLYDATQTVAKSYQAACTPDFYIFDASLACRYRGRLDASTPGNHLPVTGSDLIQALEAVLAGQPVFEPQYPSMGCNIKWKKAESVVG